MGLEGNIRVQGLEYFHLRSVHNFDFFIFRYLLSAHQYIFNLQYDEANISPFQQDISVQLISEITEVWKLTCPFSYYGEKQ